MHIVPLLLRTDSPGIIQGGYRCARTWKDTDAYEHRWMYMCKGMRECRCAGTWVGTDV